MVKTNRNIIFICCLILVTLLSACSRKKNIKDMVYIPSGEFIMGSDSSDMEDFAREFGVRKGKFFEDAKPAKKIFLEAFYIDKFEVTNREYKAFIDATGYAAPPTWVRRGYPAGKGDHPVSNVTWFDAHAYCKWAGKRLPTEREWEKAARGPDGNLYPWGNKYSNTKANLSKVEITAPVGSYKGDRSYYGVYDMGGNVTEWVNDWYEPYPWSKARNNDFGKKYKVLRGGSGGSLGHYNLGKIFSRTSFRQYSDPYETAEDGGFRCAKSAEVK